MVKIKIFLVTESRSISDIQRDIDMFLSSNDIEYIELKFNDDLAFLVYKDKNPNYIEESPSTSITIS
jgi:hypothetical protein